MSAYVILFHLFVILGLLGAVHALLTRRHPNSALVWVAICVSLPGIGILAYLIFGVNRVRRSAERLRQEFEEQDNQPEPVATDAESHTCTVNEISEEFAELEKIGRSITGTLPLKGNSITPLYNGRQAYPAMLEAISNAKQSVYLSTFLFEKDGIGKKFYAQLVAAKNRGISVAVLLDGFGLLWSWIRLNSLLKRNGVPVTRFLPIRLFPPQIRMNLRNHRKLLLIDGHTGFTGGMNIGGSRTAKGRQRMSDMHYKLTGPIVSQLQEVFFEDWAYANGEKHIPKPPPMKHTGRILSRVIKDGPDNPDNPLHLSIVATINTARTSIRIMTPYFLPSRELTSALTVAALRGVDVRIILPAKSNLPFVHWAMRNYMGELLEAGVRIFYQPPPFCHTKLLIIDGRYTQFGSANLDPRSLQLNFELNIEALDAELAQTLNTHVNTTIKASRELSCFEIAGRSLPVRMRDAFFWLFSPYL
ncbi:MAG: cardiolipin synthase [Desulfovibrionales bacterium]|nr:cardiolipin synthase [Desulfovibrionales bacterium]